MRAVFLRPEHDAEVVQQIRESRGKDKSAFEIPGGLRGAVQRTVRLGTVGKGNVTGGLKSDGPVIVTKGIFIAVLLLQAEREIIGGCRITGFEEYRFVERQSGAGWISRLLFSGCECAPERSLAGEAGAPGGQCRHGGLGSPTVNQGKAEIEPEIVPPGRCRKGAPDAGNSGCRMAGLEHRGSQKVPAVCFVGQCTEHTTISGYGLGDSAGLMQAVCSDQHFANLHALSPFPP